VFALNPDLSQDAIDCDANQGGCLDPKLWEISYSNLVVKGIEVLEVEN
jgi:hypothetical protein